MDIFTVILQKEKRDGGKNVTFETLLILQITFL